MITAAAGGAAAQEDRVDMPNLPGLRDEREFSLGVYSPDLREPPAGKPRGHRLAYFPVCVFPCWRSAWLTRLCDRRNTGPPRGWRSRRLQQRRYPSSARHPAPQPGRRQEVLRSAAPSPLSGKFRSSPAARCSKRSSSGCQNPAICRRRSAAIRSTACSICSAPRPSRAPRWCYCAPRGRSDSFWRDW